MRCCSTPAAWHALVRRHGSSLTRFELLLLLIGGMVRTPLLYTLVEDVGDVVELLHVVDVDGGLLVVVEPHNPVVPAADLL